VSVGIKKRNSENAVNSSMQLKEINPMDPKFDPSPIYWAPKPSASIDYSRYEEMKLHQPSHKKMTPSFTTSEDPIHKRHNSDLISKHGEPSIAGHFKELAPDEIVLPNEIELFSHYDGSPTSHRLREGKSRGLLDNSMNAQNILAMQNDFMRMSMARTSMIDMRQSKAFARKSIVKPGIEQNTLIPSHVTHQPEQETGFF